MPDIRANGPRSGFVDCRPALEESDVHVRDCDPTKTRAAEV